MDTLMMFAGIGILVLAAMLAVVLTISKKKIEGLEAVIRQSRRDFLGKEATAEQLRIDNAALEQNAAKTLETLEMKIHFLQQKSEEMVKAVTTKCERELAEMENQRMAFEITANRSVDLMEKAIATKDAAEAERDRAREKILEKANELQAYRAAVTFALTKLTGCGFQGKKNELLEMTPAWAKLRRLADNKPVMPDNTTLPSSDVTSV